MIGFWNDITDIWNDDYNWVELGHICQYQAHQAGWYYEFMCLVELPPMLHSL